MKILYYNPSCGSGIEQAGFIFLFLLKKLGHTIDFWNTQCANLQENYISKTIDDYDAIVINSPHEPLLQRMVPERRDNIFLINHNNERFPSFYKILSLNYPFQEQFYFRHKRTNIRMPLTYPYAYKKMDFRSERKYRFVFVGRWDKRKFGEKVKNFMAQNNLAIDMACITRPDDEYGFREIVKEYKLNASMDEVMDVLSHAEYLLLPSTVAECISFVCGEALVVGCLPVVYETKYEEHQQFFNTINCYSMDEFNQTILALKDKKIPTEQRKEIFEFSQRNWSISKTLEELKLVFGTGKNGKINVMHNDHDEMKGNLSYNNACIITGETFPENFFLKRYL